MGKTQQTPEDRLEERIGLNRQLASYDYERIRSNRDLSEEAKRRLLQEKYQEHLEEHRQLVEERKRLRGESKQDMESKLFNLKTSTRPELRYQEQMLFRDAADRVKKAQDPEELEQLLGVAELSGDETLRHAVFVSAHRRGNQRILEKVFESDPALAADYASYMESQSKTASSREIAENLFDSSGVPKPTELS